MGRTVASSTSTTRLDFSCMTPMRIQVLYCVSIEEEDHPDHRRPSALCSLAAGFEGLDRHRLGPADLLAAELGVSPAAW